MNNRLYPCIFNETTSRQKHINMDQIDVATLIPALLVVIIGEIARIRAAIYYVVGGGLSLAAMPLLARMSESGNVVIPETTVLQVFATAGFAGGFVYWLVAGRNA